MIGFPDGWKPKFKGNSKTMMANWQKYGDLYGLALRED
jgi:type IV pilus assembly protein PilM